MWWVVLIAVLSVVASAAVIIGRLLLDPRPASLPVTTPPPVVSAPPAPTAAPTPSTTSTVPALAGAGAAVAYVQTTAAIYRIDLATGHTTQTLAAFDNHDASLHAGKGWVLCKVHGQAGDGFLIRNNQLIRPLPAGLAGDVGYAETGPGDSIWLVPDVIVNDHMGPETITLHRLDGTTIAAATLHLPATAGYIFSDRTGYLLETTVGRIYRHTPTAVTPIATGTLIAVGPHQLLTWNCDNRARCGMHLLDRATGHSTTVPDRAALTALNDDVTGDDSNDEVSPDGRHVLLVGHGDPFAAIVLDTRTGRTHQLPGSPTNDNPSSQYGWTANSRWLLALTDHQLRAYDTLTGTTRTIPVTGLPLIHLAVS